MGTCATLFIYLSLCCLHLDRHRLLHGKTYAPILYISVTCHLSFTPLRYIPNTDFHSFLFPLPFPCAPSSHLPFLYHLVSSSLIGMACKQYGNRLLLSPTRSGSISMSMLLVTLFQGLESDTDNFRPSRPPPLPPHLCVLSLAIICHLLSISYT
jgi:hypothetical protein